MCKAASGQGVGVTGGFEVAPELISNHLGVNTVLQQRNPSRVICLNMFACLSIRLESIHQRFQASCYPNNSHPNNHAVAPILPVHYTFDQQGSYPPLCPASRYLSKVSLGCVLGFNSSSSIFLSTSNLPSLPQYAGFSVPLTLASVIST